MRHSNRPRRKPAVNQVQEMRRPAKILEARLPYNKRQRVTLVQLNEEFARLAAHCVRLQNDIVRAAKANRHEKILILGAQLADHTGKATAVAKKIDMLTRHGRERDEKRTLKAQLADSLRR